MKQPPKPAGNGARTPRPREPIPPEHAGEGSALLQPPRGSERKELVSEMLLLPDGRVLVHSLTPVMASILKELNPDDESIQPRAEETP